MLNNKKIGSDFEQEFCKILADNGFWVHFITPDRTGSQPFDVTAAKNGIAYAFDCKTCEAPTFSVNRLENNQIMAFDKWLMCGNENAYIAIKHNGNVYLVPYITIIAMKSVKISEVYMMKLEEFFWSRRNDT